MIGSRSHGRGEIRKDYNLNDKMIGELIEHLKSPYSNHDYDDIWATFILLEERGFDVSLMRSILHFRMVSDSDDLNPLRQLAPLTEQQEREIVIALRKKARECSNRPPLTEQEYSVWEYKPSPVLNDRGNLTEAQEAIAVDGASINLHLDIIRQELPGLLDAYKVIRQINSVERRDDGAPRLGGRWIRDLISVVIANHNVDLSGRNVTALTNAVWSTLNSEHLN